MRGQAAVWNLVAGLKPQHFFLVPNMGLKVPMTMTDLIRMCWIEFVAVLAGQASVPATRLARLPACVSERVLVSGCFLLLLLAVLLCCLSSYSAVLGNIVITAWAG